MALWLKNIMNQKFKEFRESDSREISWGYKSLLQPTEITIAKP